MNIIIDRDYLNSTLNNISKAISNKPQMPILTGIKMEVKKGCIVFTANNTDISIQVCLDDLTKVTIKDEGNIVLPGKYFCEIIRKCDSKEIEMQVFEENTVKILANQSSFTLNLYDYSLFPYISFDNSNTFIYIDGINLKQIIKKTSFATSISESKMVLTGVNFQIEQNKLEAVATDGFRLSKKSLIFDKDNPNLNVIVPSKALDELNKIIEDAEELLQIHFTSTKILVKYKNILFQTRLIEGTFPNTKSLIPNEFITELTFNKTDLISSIDRASLLNSSDISNIIKFSINNEDIIVSSQSNEIGLSLEKIKPLHISNEVVLETAFSSKNFLEAVKAFDSNEITIHFTGEVRPFIISSKYDPQHIQLILPVRI